MRRMNGNTLEVLDEQGNVLLAIEEDFRNNTLSLKLKGVLSEQAAHEFEDELSAAFFACKRIEIDMHETEYISALAMRILLDTQQKAESKNAVMVLYNLSEPVMQTFVKSGFTELLRIEER